MKKLLIFLACALLAFTSLGCQKGTAETASHDENTIVVYNWGEYISNGDDDTLDVIADFTDKTGIKVNYITYASNEELYTKLKSGSAYYDVIIPSDYMISKLIKEDMLLPIDWNSIVATTDTGKNSMLIQNILSATPPIATTSLLSPKIYIISFA